MINFFEKDKKRRKLYIKNLKKRSALRTILKNKDIVINERYDAQIKLFKMNTNSSKIRLKKRCVLTGRASGIVGPFNISRIKLRDILRKVVSSENGTASLADKNGYYVGGKTGTAESYGDKKKE